MKGTGRFEEVFARVLGPEALAALTEHLAVSPAILLAGNQLTGKSTAARQLGKVLGLPGGSTGTVVRGLAQEAGLSIEAMSQALWSQPDTDARLDHAAFAAVARGQVGLFESRLAGWMGAWLRARGRTGLFAVFVTCSARERALRYVKRELDAEMAGQLAELLAPQVGNSLADALHAVAALPHPRAGEVAARMDAVVRRELHDRERLLHLYGVDFLDPSPCDLVVDNSARTPEQTREFILAAVRGVLRLP